jgi:2-C-methyl-D-erythritol 4-phosphate cytidylyltransferase/2-C-methyl-D-erythritol 2,4-cyclodiphosphate synthase
MRVSALIAAGGRGVRLGAGQPKQFLELAGRPMLDLSIDALTASPRIDEIVVALPASHVAEAATSWNDRSSKPVRFVEGGRRRQDSVARAFAGASAAAEIIVIHDAARPFVSGAVIERTIDAAAAHGAAIAAIPVRDTVKQASAALVEGSHVVEATLRREEIFLAQTPQAFRREILAAAFAASGDLDASDEALLVERAGFAVHLVPGDPANVKVTTPEDLEAARERAESFASETANPPVAWSAMPLVRIGTGYDLHRLVEGRPLILGGVAIPFEKGLAGHSDADILCHAVTDAVLGAAAMGDIGRLFPDTDPRWKGADSVGMLREAVAEARTAGFAVSTVDATIIAERPKLVAHLGAMRANLAKALGVEPWSVSVKAKTNEGMDSMGRGESMACHAVALVVKR